MTVIPQVLVVERNTSTTSTTTKPTNTVAPGDNTNVSTEKAAAGKAASGNNPPPSSDSHNIPPTSPTTTASPTQSSCHSTTPPVVCWLCCDNPEKSATCACSQLYESSLRVHSTHGRRTSSPSRFEPPPVPPFVSAEPTLAPCVGRRPTLLWYHPPSTGAAAAPHRRSTTFFSLELKKKQIHHMMMNGGGNSMNGSHTANHTRRSTIAATTADPATTKMVDDLLARLSASSSTNGTTNTNGGSATATNGNKNKIDLEVAHTEMQQLQLIQDLLQNKLAEKKNQVDELQIRVSPFLSFDEDLLEHFVQFLEEESLLCLEQVMPQFMDSPAVYNQWKLLDSRRTFGKSASLECTARERGIRFVLASQYARKMEQSAVYHYNPRRFLHEAYEWPTQLYTRQDLQKDFYSYDNGDEPPPNLEFFIRLSLRAPTAKEDEDDDEDNEDPSTTDSKVLLEGFISDYADMDPWDQDQYTIIELDDYSGSDDDSSSAGSSSGGASSNNTKVHLVCNNLQLIDQPSAMGVNVYQNWMRKNIIEWPAAQMESYMKRLSLTVLACEPHQPQGTSSTIPEEEEEDDNDNDDQQQGEVKPSTSMDESVDSMAGADNNRRVPRLSSYQSQLVQSHLVVATRGFHSFKGEMAIMPSRPTLAKARTANLLDCVNVALKPTEELKGKIGFRLMIDWGTHDVFTKRKSIFER